MAIIIFLTLEKNLNLIPMNYWKIFFKIFNSISFNKFKVPNSEIKIKKIINRMMKVNDFDELFLSLIQISQSNSVLEEENIKKSDFLDLYKNNHELMSLDTKRRYMTFDMMTYLPDDILVKVDRASMYHGLEARLPFLDHRLLEFMSGVPVSAKVIKGERKPILRNLVSKYIPKELLTGSKSGFAVPIGAWLRGPLREWSNDLLSESQLRRESFFDVSVVSAIWDQHQRQIWDHSLTLWAILMFQQWKNATQP